MSTYADSSARQTVSDEFEPAHQPSFPRMRESISEFGQSLFKSDELSFINGFPPARE